MPSPAGPLLCRRCHRAVKVFRDQFDAFEHMHYVCFRYEFGHAPVDPDEECGAGGCPSAAINPRLTAAPAPGRRADRRPPPSRKPLPRGRPGIRRPPAGACGPARCRRVPALPGGCRAGYSHGARWASSSGNSARRTRNSADHRSHMAHKPNLTLPLLSGHVGFVRTRRVRGQAPRPDGLSRVPYPAGLGIPMLKCRRPGLCRRSIHPKIAFAGSFLDFHAFRSSRVIQAVL
jgi:hypothetical protein